METVDTTATLDIASSPKKLAMLAAMSIAFVVGGAFMTTATTSTPKYPAELIRFIGWVAIAFFGFCLLIALWRLFTQRGPVITLSPQGLRDIRVAHDIVPWPAVASLGTWQHSGQSVMVVGLKPGEEAKLRLTTIARLSRRANAKLGADGLAVTAQGTKTSHERLLAAAMAYASRYGGG